MTIVLEDARYEITSLLIDNRPMREESEATFNSKWMIDASRRDISINTMSLCADGLLYDYFNARNDIKNGIVKIMGDLTVTIQEDPHRILRFFRLHAYYSKRVHKYDPEVIRVISANAHLLEKVSRNRKSREMHKLLVCPNAASVLQQMSKCGLDRYLGLPKNLWRYKKRLADCLSVQSRTSNHTTILTTLLESIDDLRRIRWTMPPSERKLARFLLEQRQQVGENEKITVDMVALLVPKVPMGFITEWLRCANRTDIIPLIQNDALTLPLRINST